MGTSIPLGYIRKKRVKTISGSTAVANVQFCLHEEKTSRWDRILAFFLPADRFDLRDKGFSEEGKRRRRVKRQERSSALKFQTVLEDWAKAPLQLSHLGAPGMAGFLTSQRKPVSTAAGSCPR